MIPDFCIISFSISEMPDSEADELRRLLETVSMKAFRASLLALELREDCDSESKSV